MMTELVTFDFVDMLFCCFVFFILASVSCCSLWDLNNNNNNNNKQIFILSFFFFNSLRSTNCKGVSQGWFQIIATDKLKQLFY